MAIHLRRKPKLSPPEPYHLQPYTYKYELEQLVLPEPWRDVNDVYAIPLDVVMPFVDSGRLSMVRNYEQAHIQALASSILVEGLREPCEMLLDESGKFRFDNGYHRLCIMIERPSVFPRIPVTIRRTSKPIKGFGRLVSMELDAILASFTKYQA